MLKKIFEVVKVIYKVWCWRKFSELEWWNAADWISGKSSLTSVWLMLHEYYKGKRVKDKNIL